MATPRALRVTIEATIPTGGKWVPIGYGIEIMTRSTERVGVVHIRVTDPMAMAALEPIDENDNRAREPRDPLTEVDRRMSTATDAEQFGAWASELYQTMALLASLVGTTKAQKATLEEARNRITGVYTDLQSRSETLWREWSTGMHS